MNVFALLCIALVPSSLAGSSEEKIHDPLPILYYPAENKYILSDMNILKKLLEDKKTTAPTFTHILFYCSLFDDYGYSSCLQLKNIIPIAAAKVTDLVKCTSTYQPDIMDDKSEYKTNISYEILDSSPDKIGVDLFQKYNLPQFPIPNDDDNEIIPIFWFKHEYPRRLAYETLHRIYSYNRGYRSSQTCDNYELPWSDTENEFFEAYKSTRQNKLFQFYQKPSSWGDDIFAPHKLVPIEDFAEDSVRMAACVSIYTTSPVWKQISESTLYNVEKTIQNVAEKYRLRFLTIKTQVFEILKMKTTPDGELKEVFLDYPEKTIPVMKYFVKIAGYNSSTLEDIYTPGKDLPRRYILIVVHNDYEPISDRICNIDKKPTCRMYGWHVTTNLAEDQSVYCCTFDDPQLKENQHIEIPTTHEPFDLNKIVPVESKSDQ